MGYYLAKSLVDLRDEINRRWPNRDRTSDGWIGDTSHQARVSDHNPDYGDGGVVRAIDVDKDGINVSDLLDATIGHSAVQYVIHNRKIWSRSWGWTAHGYTGINPHKAHVHVSLRHLGSAENWSGDWFKSEKDKPEFKPDPQVVAWQKHIEVEADGYWGNDTDDASQRMRNAAYMLTGDGPKKGFSLTKVQAVVDTKADGDMGPDTMEAMTKWVKRAQDILNVKADGFWGPTTDAKYMKFRSENLLD